MARARNMSLVLAFAAVLLAPTLASVLGLDPFATLDEKRGLAKKPELAPWSRDGLRKIPAFAQAWESYFNDHFGFRKLLIGSYRLAMFHLLQISPNPAVVVGRSDGTSRWLFFEASANHDGIGLDSILGRQPYSAAQLASIVERLESTTDLVRGSGARLVIAICPDKQTIYPEYLPRGKRPQPGTLSRLDQFWAKAESLKTVPLVDLRIPLRQAKAQRLLYYPSDTHWNWRGEVLAYGAVAQILAAQDPSRGLLPLEKMQWLVMPPRVGDLTALMGLPATGGDSDLAPVPSSIAALAPPRRGKLLFIHDSFFAGVLPYAEMQFEKVTDVRQATMAVRGVLVDPGRLAAEKPDVVILESVERYWTAD